MGLTPTRAAAWTTVDGKSDINIGLQKSVDYGVSYISCDRVEW
jgi:hypothetical protein